MGMQNNKHIPSRIQKPTWGGRTHTHKKNIKQHLQSQTPQKYVFIKLKLTALLLKRATVKEGSELGNRF
jgi:hypothetical protein